jgi:hypothetical protein
VLNLSRLFFAKVLVAAVMIGVAAEVAKRNPFQGALIIALPLTSILVMGWLYADARSDMLVTKFVRDVFMVVPVSLVFFVPFLLEIKTHLGLSPTCASAWQCSSLACGCCAGLFTDRICVTAGNNMS